MNSIKIDFYKLVESLAVRLAYWISNNASLTPLSVSVSISILFEELFYEQRENKKNTFKNEYDEIVSKINYAGNYKSKLKKYCNKYFAHTDIKSLEQQETEQVNLSVSWSELINPINNAKAILNCMFIICGKKSFNYSENVYDEYQKQFWELINF